MTNAIVRILSRPTAKPYRSAELDKDERPYLDDDGYVSFGPDDIENPKNWSTARRSYVTVAVVLLVTNATFASSSPSGSFESMSEYFGISIEVAGLTITLFLLGYCAGPLLFAPLSEFYGRRYIFYLTFLSYLGATFLCAFAPNFASLLVGRFLAGTFVSAPLTNGPGVLADLWGPVARINAMAAFSCMVWAGPALGPVLSGFLNMTLGWRWCFYMTLWLGGASLVFLFTIPETYGPAVLKHKAVRLRRAGFEGVRAPIEDTDRSLLAVYKVALTRPWIILFDPISFLCAVYMSFVYLLLYMLFSMYPIIFQEKRGWNSGVGELPLLGTVVGAFLGAFVVVFDSRRQQRVVDSGRKLEPEDRLPLAMVGGVLFAACNFWLAWSGEFVSVHWIVPTLAGVFLSMSMMLIFVAYLSYLVDTYLMYAASAIAANTIVRSAVGSTAPLFTNYMFTALGIGGGGSLIGGVACLLAVIPFAFYKYGRRIRIRSRFAPTEERPVREDEERGELDDDDDKRKSDGLWQKAEEGGGAGAAAAAASPLHPVAMDSGSDEEITTEDGHEKEAKGEGDGYPNGIGGLRDETTTSEGEEIETAM